MGGEDKDSSPQPGEQFKKGLRVYNCTTDCTTWLNWENIEGSAWEGS